MEEQAKTMNYAKFCEIKEILKGLNCSFVLGVSYNDEKSTIRHNSLWGNEAELSLLTDNLKSQIYEKMQKSWKSNKCKKVKP